MNKKINLYVSIIVIALGYIHSQCVSETAPKTFEDCLNNSDDQNYCCMISTPGYQPDEQKCVQVSKNNYYGQNRYTLNGETWNMNCGSEAEPVFVKGGQCGNSDPIYAVDCWAFSTLHNSCCFYLSANTTGTPACQWYDEKHSGSILSTKSHMILSCNATHSSVSYSMLTLMVIVLLGMIL
jgi:hypothetical protein